MPRHTKYDDKKAAQIATLLRSGCTRRDATGSVNISHTTFYTWLEKNLHFFQLVEAAESFCAVKMTTLIVQAADTDPKYALEWLKRRRRDEWGDNINLNRLSDDDLIALATGGLPGGRKAEDPA